MASEEDKYNLENFQKELDGENSDFPEKEIEPVTLQTMNKFDAYFQNVEDAYEPWKVFACLLAGLAVSSGLSIFLLNYLSGSLLIKVLLVMAAFFFTLALATSLLYRFLFKTKMSLLAVYVWLFMFVIDG